VTSGGYVAKPSGAAAAAAPAEPSRLTFGSDTAAASQLVSKLLPLHLAQNVFSCGGRACGAQFPKRDQERAHGGGTFLKCDVLPRLA
jgi:hypothetical protein